MVRAWQYQVLEGLRSCGTGVHEEDVGLHQSLLASRAPKPQLAVVLVVRRHPAVAAVAAAAAALLHLRDSQLCVRALTWRH